MSTIAESRGYVSGKVQLVLANWHPTGDDDYPLYQSLDLFKSELAAVCQLAKEHGDMWVIATFLPPSNEPPWVAEVQCFLESNGYYVFRSAGAERRAPYFPFLGVGLSPSNSIEAWSPEQDLSDDRVSEISAAIKECELLHKQGISARTTLLRPVQQRKSWESLLPLESRIVAWVKQAGYEVSFSDEIESWTQGYTNVVLEISTNSGNSQAE